MSIVSDDYLLASLKMTVLNQISQTLVWYASTCFFYRYKKSRFSIKSSEFFIEIDCL